MQPAKSKPSVIETSSPLFGMTSRPPTMASSGSGLAAAFDTHIVSQNATPVWWQQLKKKALDTYRELPMPTRKSEQWRFAGITGLSLDGYDFTAAAPAAERTALAVGTSPLEAFAGRITFVDNHLAAFDRINPELEKRGVIWLPLAEALVRHGDLLQEYFMAEEPHLGSEKFAALHTAFVNGGTLLYVPKGVEITLPFLAHYWAAAPGAAILPHTLLIAGENAKVSLIDVFSARDPENKALACGFTHVFAGRAARVDTTTLQTWSNATLGFQINSLVADRDATINSLAVNLGSSHFRSETHAILKGAGSHVEMASLSIADRDQEIDQRTLQTHLAPNAKSNLLFKNALSGDSRTIFSGLIRVAEDAQKTDAYQSNRNLLLSDTAEANSLPGLEIKANDVRCTHGATTSQIDESELFYLLARGIDKRAARELLVFGFFEEVIGRIQSEPLAERVRSLIRAKFRAAEITPA